MSPPLQSIELRMLTIVWHSGVLILQGGLFLAWRVPFCSVSDHRETPKQLGFLNWRQRPSGPAAA